MDGNKVSERNPNSNQCILKRSSSGVYALFSVTETADNRVDDLATREEHSINALPLTKHRGSTPAP